MNDKQQRLQNMMEVWYIDLQQMMDDNATNREITAISELKLKRIKREIDEEIEAYEETK